MNLYEILELNLEGNPASFDILYRGFMICRIKTLKLLDGKRITEDEKRASNRIGKRVNERRSESEKNIQKLAQRLSLFASMSLNSVDKEFWKRLKKYGKSTKTIKDPLK